MKTQVDAVVCVCVLPRLAPRYRSSTHNSIDSSAYYEYCIIYLRCYCCRCWWPFRFDRVHLIGHLPSTPPCHIFSRCITAHTDAQITRHPTSSNIHNTSLKIKNKKIYLNVAGQKAFYRIISRRSPRNFRNVNCILFELVCFCVNYVTHTENWPEAPKRKYLNLFLQPTV